MPVCSLASCDNEAYAKLECKEGVLPLIYYCHRYFTVYNIEDVYDDKEYLLKIMHEPNNKF